MPGPLRRLNRKWMTLGLVEMTMKGFGRTCWRPALWVVLNRCIQATSGLGLGKSFASFGSAASAGVVAMGPSPPSKHNFFVLFLFLLGLTTPSPPRGTSLVLHPGRYLYLFGSLSSGFRERVRRDLYQVYPTFHRRLWGFMQARAQTQNQYQSSRPW